MADLKEFDVVRVARSDGADTGPGYWPVTAPAPKKPAKEPTDKTPRAKPQMIRLADDDPRFVEWKVKLGIILKMELSPNPDEGNSWFVEFPRGYWPYEKSKHIWVSGYPVKSKLFKTPQEFAAHLIWLLSSSKEYKDCCCVHCNSPSAAKLAASMDETTSNTPTLLPAKPEKMALKVTPVPLPTIPGQPPSKQLETATNVPAAQVNTEIVAAAQAQAQAAARQQQQQQTTQHAELQARQQAAQAQQQRSVGWSLQSPILFRVGEQVWFQNGNTWRLGIIASQNPQQPGVHELMPLGSALIPQQNVAKQDKDMRPFQAFSVPPVAVQELSDKIFDEIPWPEKFREYGADASKRDLLLLDASKMAASKVDWSNSLWSAMSEDVQAKTITYYGCFLGAERIEVGDCLRVRNLPAELSIMSEDMVVMGLRFIYTSGDFPGAVFFRGTLYQRADPGADPSTLVPMEQLPIALRDESHWRSQVQPAAFHGWVIVGDGVRLKEKSIRGRFYPTHRVMPILNPAPFEAAVARRQIEDQHPYLNSRMDGMGRYLGRRLNRMETLGASVPAGARLGLEPFVREEMRRA